MWAAAAPRCLGTHTRGWLCKQDVVNVQVSIWNNTEQAEHVSGMFACELEPLIESTLGNLFYPQRSLDCANDLLDNWCIAPAEFFSVIAPRFNGAAEGMSKWTEIYRRHMLQPSAGPGELMNIIFIENGVYHLYLMMSEALQYWET